MTKEFYNEVYKADHPSQYGGGEDGMQARTSKLIRQTSAWLNHTGLAENAKAKILEIG